MSVEDVVGGVVGGLMCREEGVSWSARVGGSLVFGPLAHGGGGSAPCAICAVLQCAVPIARSVHVSCAGRRVE